jgi:hypothetical protein
MRPKLGRMGHPKLLDCRAVAEWYYAPVPAFVELKQTIGLGESK